MGRVGNRFGFLGRPALPPGAPIPEEKDCREKGKKRYVLRSVSGAVHVTLPLAGSPSMRTTIPAVRPALLVLACVGGGVVVVLDAGAAAADEPGGTSVKVWLVGRGTMLVSKATDDGAIGGTPEGAGLTLATGGFVETGGGLGTDLDVARVDGAAGGGGCGVGAAGGFGGS